MNDAEFRLYILTLEKELKECKQKLFLNRFSKLYKKNIQPCISNIKIDIDHKNNDWVVSYEHYTNNYSINNYTINNAEIYNDNLNYNKQANNITTDAATEKKKTIISFGKSKKYFIRGGIRYNIYRNSSGDLRIINSDYDLELDMEEQYELISSYANNVNIPECLALSVFIYLSDNNWDDTNLITYLSVV
jgi:hypothetical protein